jgi:hypothetical protein
MKILFIICVCVFMISCKKEKTVQEALPEGTVIKTGTFVTNSKPTSGTVKIIAGANNVKNLVFENFQTGSGPDVRVWLSPNLTTTSYQEVGTLRATNGTFSYTLPASIDFTANNNVLIWCEDFNVLFGSATLQ